MISGENKLMAYRDLERRMGELGRKEELESTLTTIRTRADADYARTLSYFLSIVNDLEQNGIRDYAVIGGYGVLAHLVHKVSESAIPLWRGSTDIDMGTQSLGVESVLKGNYDHFQRRVSHFHERKIDIEIGDAQLQKYCVIDMYLVFKGKPSPLQAYQIDEGFWERVQTRHIFSMNFPVASKMDLLHMKLAVKAPTTGLPRPHDIEDMFTLLGLLAEEETASETWTTLPAYGKNALASVFQLPNYQDWDKVREALLIEIPKWYLDDLKSLARHTA